MTRVAARYAGARLRCRARCEADPKCVFFTTHTDGTCHLTASCKEQVRVNPALNAWTYRVVERTPPRLGVSGAPLWEVMIGLKLL